MDIMVTLLLILSQMSKFTKQIYQVIFYSVYDELQRDCKFFKLPTLILILSSLQKTCPEATLFSVI